MIMAVHVSKVF